LLIREVGELLNDLRNTITGEGFVVEPKSEKKTFKEMIFTRQDFIPNALDYLRHIMWLTDSFLENGQHSPTIFEKESSATSLPDGSCWQPCKEDK
jgi:hypothetical protein